MHKLSVVLVTKNAEELLSSCLASVRSIADEIIAVDVRSTDRTRSILKHHQATIITTTSNHLGRNKARGIQLTKHRLIFLIDSDEIVSKKLQQSILRLKRRKRLAHGYRLSFHNHFMRRRLRHGGEGYRMVRLFQRNKATMHASSVHEHLEVPSGDIRTLAGHIDHFSYRSIPQMFRKFSAYALLEAAEKHREGERSSFKKIALYPIHMFWARYVVDRGYRDGLWRIPLDLGFAYMEWLTYTSLALRNRA